MNFTHLAELLWNQYGVLALGWIVAFAEGLYVITLHRGQNAIYKEYINFAKQQSESLIPILQRNAVAMETAVKATNENAERIHSMNNRMGIFLGEVSVLVREVFKVKLNTPNGN